MFFKHPKVRDEEHLDYIRRQNCYFCGRSPSQIKMTPHHVGDGIMQKRSRDDITLPACFGWTNDKRKPMGCHRYVEDHKGDYDIEKLRADAKVYWERHNKERGRNEK